MLISKRLKTIGDLISDNDIVVDVGADHGLLETYLISKNKNISITAVENKIGPYRILEENLKNYKNVHLSLSNGIECVDKHTKTVVIAGMGGLNIVSILSKFPEKTKYLNKIIIDAHRDISIVRRSIISYGFNISKEIIVQENKKFYVVIEFVKAVQKEEYSDDTLDFGYKLYKDKLWIKYKDYLIKQNNKTIEKIQDLESMQDKILYLKKLNERLENYGKN